MSDKRDDDHHNEEHKEKQRERRAELGDNDAPVEGELEKTFDATVEEGAERLQRTFPNMLITGFFGGLEVGLGVMAYLFVLHETGNHLLAALAFGIGFIALLLAGSELFTENFLMPVAAVIAREASVKRLAMLWGGTVVANLAGGWLFMGLLMIAVPAWHELVIETAREFAEAPLTLETAALAILGGSTITLLTRMHQGTESTVAKIIASVAAAFLA
ncbi:formate/nitrite transporter family protein [Microcella indica]|uniref:formate/nitrite transporter family protein n=1 Tax=Microcella indica TaxID=2750620 RepID=UPI0015CF8028|nr:formate/nitrite transporter family protein [Microcella indica]